MVVGDDRDGASGNRQHDLRAGREQRLVARVGGVHRDRHVGEHRLGPGGGDDDMVLAVRRGQAIRQRVAEVPEFALHLARLDLEIGDRGLEAGVPVDQALVAIDQAFVVQLHEYLDDCLGEVRVHRELFAAPVHRTAQAAQLLRDLPAAFRLPLPHLGDEILAPVIGALVLPFGHLPFDDHLRGDAGMVRPDDPQRVLAAQPFVADEHVLQRIVERMADMQRARHIGRRVDDGKGGRVGAMRAEQAVRLPMRGPARLDGRGVERLGQAGFGGVGGRGSRIGHGRRHNRYAPACKPRCALWRRRRPRRDMRIGGAQIGVQPAEYFAIPLHAVAALEHPVIFIREDNQARRDVAALQCSE